MTPANPDPPSALAPRIFRILLFLVAGASLLGGSVTAQATESEFAAQLATQHTSHSNGCALRCPLGHPSHHNLANGWPYPILPLGLLTISAASVCAAVRLARPDVNPEHKTPGPARPGGLTSVRHQIGRTASPDQTPRAPATAKESP